MAVIEIIKEAIESTGRHPFLFVGSGLSRRYLNTDNWEGLLRHFCTEYSSNEFQYNVYSSRAGEEDYYGKQPAIASMLETDFNEAVLTDKRYVQFREKYKMQLREGVSPLKLAVADYLSNYHIKDDSAEIELLRKMSKRSISGIITTNYDNLMESVFPQFDVYVGQEELIFSSFAGIGEIYKIHGSVANPESLVLTSKDYENFEKKSSYLIAKLLTIFMEYPVIFIGYSLSDKNIRNIFMTISKSLSQEKLALLKDRLIFVNYNYEEKITRLEMQFDDCKSINMTCISTSDFASIYESILAVRAKYNPTILRELRKDIYALANDVGSNERIIATGFEGLNDISEANQFVLGIATVKNGHMIKAEQLYEDIVLDNQYFQPSLVVTEYLPELLKNNSGGLPMYKYLREYDGEIYERVKNSTLKYEKIDDFLNEQLRRQKQSFHKQNGRMSVKDIINMEGDQAYRKLILLEEDELNIDDLLEYLRKYLKDHTSKCLQGNSELKRLIRMYDLMRYK